MPKIDPELTKEQAEILDRVSQASKQILAVYQKVNEFLNSDDEFKAAVGLAQIAAGLTNAAWEESDASN